LKVFSIFRFSESWIHKELFSENSFKKFERKVVKKELRRKSFGRRMDDLIMTPSGLASDSAT